MSGEEGQFDLALQKERITDGWDALAETWDSWAAVVDEWFAPATSVLIDLLRLKAKDRVLELASGSGGFTLRLARAVGPDGRVLATDSSPNMVKLAARNVRSAGLSNVVVRVMDGEHPDLTWASMDAIACRQGFMFFADPAAAMERLYRILRPGGRLGVTVFSSPARNDFMTTPVSILSRRTNSETQPEFSAKGPGPFSLAEPELLESIFRRARFEQVTTRSVPSPLHLPSIQDLLRFDQQFFGGIVSELPPAQQEEAWREVVQASTTYVGSGSSGAPCELIVTSGTRPSRQPGTG